MDKPMQMSSFKVRIVRHYKDQSSEMYYGVYVSDVYAINGNSFLVYDPGECDCPPGFTWVDFTETMTSLENKDKIEPVVTLYEE